MYQPTPSASLAQTGKRTVLRMPADLRIQNNATMLVARLDGDGFGGVVVAGYAKRRYAYAHADGDQNLVTVEALQSPCPGEQIVCEFCYDAVACSQFTPRARPSNLRALPLR